MSGNSLDKATLIENELNSLVSGGYASPEAIERLQLAYSRVVPGATYPASDDVEGWSALSKEYIAGTMPYIHDLKKKYEPRIVPLELGGVHVLDVRPKDWIDDGTVLVYTHGGAYTLMNAKSMLGSVLPFAHETGRRIISIDYTTAPALRWQGIIDQVVTVFRALIENGIEWNQIGVYGDSAGGGLMTGALLRMRDMLLGQPRAVVLWSPWVDLTRTGLSHYALEGYDALLEDDSFLPNAAGAYADPEDQRNPYVSPVHADFNDGYPPTLIQGGTRDMLFSGFVQLYQKLDTAGKITTLDLYDGMQHAFIGSWEDVPEARIAREKAKKWFEKWLGQEERLKCKV